MADRGAPPSRLSSADHVLIHAVGWLVCNLMADDPDNAVMLEAAREALPSVTRAHPVVARFAAAAEDILSAAPGRERSAARSRARGAVLYFHMRRAGDALEVFRRGNVDA